jgi:streptomycin 6-kinase
VAPIRISERLGLSLGALGPAGAAWRTALPGLLAGLAADWSMTVGAALDGGQAGYVAEAVTRDGTPAVVKVAIPAGAEAVAPYQRQLTALRLAGGDPYVGLLRHDAPRQALLLERLGPPMAGLGWAPGRQLAALARLASRGWRPVPDDGRLPTGTEAARWHAGFIPSAWAGLGRPCAEQVVELAVRCAAAREAAFDPGRAVLVHGDVHNFNALRVTGGFRLVDPNGLAGEPAHDLGVVLARGVDGWLDELAAQEPRQVLDRVTRACRASGADPEAVWQWMFVELVSTGLFVRQLGRLADAARFLTVAGKLATAADRARRRPA